MKNGIVYITFVKNKKADRIKELKHSIKSVKKTHSNLSITLFTDKDPKIKEIDNIKIISVDSERIKQNYLYDSPYENTLYLDCDTEIVGSIEEVFGLMERFDIAATHDLIRKDKKKSDVYPDYAVIPDGFPEYAGGVILFKKSDAVKNFFEVWKRNFNTWCKLSGIVKDQPSFRVSLWQCSNLHVHTLPPEFNIRTKKYHNIVSRIKHEHDMWRK
jgi:hypothetical protein